MDPKSKRDLDVEALRSLFVRESRRRPLVLVVEDLHWMDKTSEQFLDLFIGGLVGSPDSAAAAVSAGIQPFLGKQVLLPADRTGPAAGLGERSARVSHSRGGQVAPELQDLILDRAAGNPLYMEEFTQNLVEKGAILL